MRNSIYLAIGLLSLLAPAFAYAEGVGTCAAPPERTDGWAVSTPDKQGLDAAQICAIGPRFEAWTQANVHAVLIVRNGVLVFERYFTGEDERYGMQLGSVAHDADLLHDMRSITKSVTSLMVGIAVDRGWIKSLDAPLFSFFPEYAALRTPEKDRITLRHLLTMSAGFEWNEMIPYTNPVNSERRMTAAPDPIRFTLEQPLVAAPGRIYNYSGGATTVLAAILKKATGKTLDQLAQQELFTPLGIQTAEWMRFDSGDPLAASGLRLKPRDLAKIGQLVLARGVWQGKQIVSAAWIDESTRPHINGEGTFFYGYQWWLGRSLIDGREITWIAGYGLGGQRVVIVPSKNLVVVLNAGLYRSPNQSAAMYAVLLQHVLPAAR